LILIAAFLVKFKLPTNSKENRGEWSSRTVAGRMKRKANALAAQKWWVAERGEPNKADKFSYFSKLYQGSVLISLS
jgi:hypothetical protein